jgi:hypothetical protein
MELLFWLLMPYAGVGAVDVLYNHFYCYRLHAHASSFMEHVSHTVLIVNLVATVTLLVFVAMGDPGVRDFPRHPSA